MGERLQRYAEWAVEQDPNILHNVRKIARVMRPVRSGRGYVKTLVHLGFRYGRAGHLQEALATSDEAVALARRHRRPDLLAKALSFQALYRWGAHDNEGAVTSSTEAIRLLEPLAAEKPGRYGPLLVQATKALGNALFELDRPADALPHAEELVRRLRPLAAAEPEDYEDELAWALDLDGRCRRDTGQRDEARESATEAVAILRRLASSGQERYLSALASALCNLGDLGDAEKHYLEAVEIRRRLGTGETAHVAELLRLSIQPLADAERLEEARRVGTEALALYRKLAETDDKHALEVPLVLWVLGTFGEPAERLAYLEETVRTWRATEAPTQNAFEVTLAGMLLDLADCLGENGRDGRAAAEEAVALLREQALDWPDLYLDDFRRAEEVLRAATESWSRR